MEKLLSLDESGRKITWDLNRFPEYEGGLHITESTVHFWIKARAPLFLLKTAESTARRQLEAVISLSQQRLKLSKICILTTVVPLNDADAYAQIVRDFEAPAARTLISQSDLFQLRLDLDHAGGRVRAYEVWADPEVCTHHLYESSFAGVMLKIRPLMDVSRLPELRLHSWGDFDNCPKFMEKLKITPKILHPTRECQVFLFRSATDAGRDHVIVIDELTLRPGTVQSCEGLLRELLRELRLAALPESRQDQLLDVRFHLKGSSLCSLQVFASTAAFERLVLGADAPYGRALSQLESLAEGPRVGAVWGPSTDRIRAHFEGTGVALRQANLLEALAQQ